MIELPYPIHDGAQKYQQIVDCIADQIITGAVKAGEQLPSIREAAEKTGLAPATVKRAYDTLEQSGFIETIPGKGSVVSVLKGEVKAAESQWQAFFSYARRDDELSGGQITELQNAICNEFELRTGNRLKSFFDKNDISLGDNWKGIIESKLVSTVFFIPIITPTYLRRPNCLSELRTMVALSEPGNALKLICPILFVDSKRAIAELADDALASMLSDTQCCRWHEIRGKDKNSPEYQEKIQEIVDKLILIDETQSSEATSNASDMRDITHNAICSVSKCDDESDGLIEQLALLEEIPDKFISNVEAISSTLETLGEIADRKTNELAPTNGVEIKFSKRIAILKSMAQEIDPIADSLQSQCETFVSNITQMDKGIAAIAIANNLNDEPSESDLTSIEELRQSIQKMVNSSRESFEVMNSFSESLKQIEILSKDLRPPIRRIRSSLTYMLSSWNTIQEWPTLL